MKYLVWGEYGPVAYEYIERTIEAENSEEARKIFTDEIKKLPIWDRIGEHNIYVEDLK